jgi:hypothetical protein
MAHVRPFSQLCATILGGVIVAAAPVNASAAQLQPINHSEFTSQLQTMLHPVADSAPGGGPGGFADLAEKVEAAVIGVASKATTTRKTLPVNRSSSARRIRRGRRTMPHGWITPIHGRRRQRPKRSRSDQASSSLRTAMP